MKSRKLHFEQPFVLMVGIAALIHSTWTLATFSGGEAPTINQSDPLSYFAWLWWVLPGFLGAVALEIGQVSTAGQIRRGEGRKFQFLWLTWNAKVITFVLLSAATYLLQLTYLLHHYPERSVSTGLSPASAAAAQIVMELIVWLSPLLLPLTMWMSVASDPAEKLVSTLQTEIGAAPSVKLDNIAIVPIESGTEDSHFLSVPHLAKSGNGSHE